VEWAEALEEIEPKKFSKIITKDSSLETRSEKLKSDLKRIRELLEDLNAKLTAQPDKAPSTTAPKAPTEEPSLPKEDNLTLAEKGTPSAPPERKVDLGGALRKGLEGRRENLGEETNANEEVSE